MRARMVSLFSPGRLRAALLPLAAFAALGVGYNYRADESRAFQLPPVYLWPPPVAVADAPASDDWRANAEGGDRGPSPPSKRIAAAGAAGGSDPDRAALPGVAFAVLVFRHGARSPLTEKYGAMARTWDLCGTAYAPVPTEVTDLDGGPRPQPLLDSAQRAVVLPGGCLKGELTLLGQRQARRLGTWLRDRYVAGPGSPEPGLLPPQWRDGAVTVRSSNLSRTISTAAGVLTGLYPDAARGTGRPVAVATTADAAEWIYPNSQSCPRLRELYSALKHVGDDASGRAAQGLAAASLGLPPGTRVDLVAVRDVWVSAAAHGLPAGGVPPEAMAAVDREASRRVAALMGAGPDPGAGQSDGATHRVRLATGQLLAELVGHLEAAAAAGGASVTPRLRLYSGHDTTVLPLQYALGLEAESWPPFMANLLFELLQGGDGAGPAYVRVLHNGSPVELRECPGRRPAPGGGDACPLDDFKAMVSAFTMPAGEGAVRECTAEHLKGPIAKEREP